MSDPTTFRESTGDFRNAGTETSQIPVRISYRIIELFSDGLYASPHKAVEELVANAFDAGATDVHVVLSPDRSADDATIIVVDNGQSMDEAGLRLHWRIGFSNKRVLKQPPRGRRQIGKFGIGKLATFALANELTHICKSKGRYYGVTMDYRLMPAGKDGGVEISKNEGVNLPLRELTESEIRGSLPSLLDGQKPGHSAIELFGPSAPESWTIAIMSDLKDMAREIKTGRLSWVLRTSMPIRPDFRLFLNGEPQVSTKMDQEPIKRWILGKDLVELGKPASAEDLEAVEDPQKEGEERWGLHHTRLGRITGFAEVYENRLTTESSFGRSHGFFVYVRDRLINAYDTHFGIPASALRYGSFARFRMEVHVDKLDDELRSTREAVRDATLAEATRNILHAVFNHARGFLTEYDRQQEPGFKAMARIRQSPGSLTRRPIVGVLKLAIEGKCSPKLLRYPHHLPAEEARIFLSVLEAKADSDAGLVTSIEPIDLSMDDGIAVLDVEAENLLINTLHPFVAAYRDSFEKDDTLALLCMAEVLTETYLYNLGFDDSYVLEVMSRRNELLKRFARSMKRTANLIAIDLLDAVTGQTQLELELVAAFNSLGFEAVHIGGKGKPDGVARAYLGALDGKTRQYSVNLEAKSKERLGKRIESKDVKFKRITAHSRDYSCEHAIIVGPDFATTLGEASALVKDARNECQSSGRTITLMRAHDLARLVRLRAIKHIGLDRLGELLKTCVSPEEAAEWVNKIEQEPRDRPPYREILEVIWRLQQEEPHEAIEFAAVKTALRLERNISLSKPRLIEYCKALAEMAQEVVVRDRTVELTQPPSIVIESAGTTLKQFPENEQRVASFDWLKL
jgi:hypothetical protein